MDPRTPREKKLYPFYVEYDDGYKIRAPYEFYYYGGCYKTLELASSAVNKLNLEYARTQWLRKN